MDDNTVLKNIFTDLSEKGYKVRPVSKDRQVVNKSFDNEYDLVLMDVNVLRDRGVEPLKIIHESETSPEMLLISGHVDQEKKQKAIGGNTYGSHTKTIDSERLHNIIKHIDFEKIKREREKKADIENQVVTGKYLWFKRVFNIYRLSQLRKVLKENMIIIVLCILAGVCAVLIGTDAHKKVSGSNYFSKQIDRLITAVEKDFGR